MFANAKSSAQSGSVALSGLALSARRYDLERHTVLMLVPAQSA